MLILRLSLICISLLFNFSSNSFAKSNHEEAANYLLQSLSKSKVYDSWIKQKCLTIEKETSTDLYYDLAVREKHEGDCLGDPVTAPIIDRFRVYSKNKILWYDVSNDKFLSYNQFVNSRKSK